MKIETGKRICKWQGWYRHDDVYVGGIKIGFVQVRTNGRGGLASLTGTSVFDGCVIGTDVRWLVNQAKDIAG